MKILSAALILLFALAQGARNSKMRNMASLYKRHDAQGARERILRDGNATEYFMDMNINHFTTNNTNVDTFKMRYIIDESYVLPDASNPPILFYCGNEGDVWTFYENSGFMTKNLSATFNAVVLLGEHRYYGKSKPYGDNAFDPDHVKYLTVDQTLMDYVHLIKAVKAGNPKYTYSPVIAFGGSYGGMLAAWFRMKYPHVIQGAHASSAPILFFPGSVSPYAFNELVTRSYNDYCPGIRQSTYLGFQVLMQAERDTTQYAAVSQIFNTCSPIVGPDQIQVLADTISGALGTMQMVDYPYATDFLGSLPANPVKTACSWAQGNYTTIKEDNDYLRMLAIMLNVFQNSTGTTNCTDVGSSLPQQGGLDDDGWNYQVCNEMVMPIAQNGKTDMFNAELWVPDAFVSQCQSTHFLNPQFDWALDNFGGRNPNKDFLHVSNIVFTNGNLDPWRAGGVLHEIPGNDKVSVFLQKGSAHHLELRLPNDQYDPADVKETRKHIEESIVQWIAEWRQAPFPRETPSTSINESFEAVM